MSIAISKKKLNSTERGALFRHFCVSKVITTAHAHKSGVIFHFFPRAFKQKKIKALRPKMTKIASRGGGGGPALINGTFSHEPPRIMFYQEYIRGTLGSTLTRG